MVKVYVDVLFLINFSVDYIVLTLIGVIFHYRVNKWKELLTAFLLSLYSLWALLFCGSYILLITTALLSAAIACRFVFPIKKRLAFAKTYLLFIMLSILFGGLTNVLFSVFEKLFGTQEIASDGKQVIVFTCLAALSSLMIWAGNKLLERGRNVDSIQLSFSFFNHKYSADLLVDSGNLAVDPLSGRHVIFLFEKYAKKHGITQYINNNEDFLKIKRVICVETAGGKKALPAYICDDIMLPDKIVKGVIAIMNDTEQTDYDGIFPTALL